MGTKEDTYEVSNTEEDREVEGTDDENSALGFLACRGAHGEPVVAHRTEGTDEFARSLSVAQQEPTLSQA